METRHKYNPIHTHTLTPSHFRHGQLLLRTVQALSRDLNEVKHEGGQFPLPFSCPFQGTHPSCLFSWFFLPPPPTPAFGHQATMVVRWPSCLSTPLKKQSFLYQLTFQPPPPSPLCLLFFVFASGSI